MCDIHGDLVMGVTWRAVAFGILGGIFSVTLTFITVGFKYATLDERLWIACLYIVSSIICGCVYRVDPNAAWDLFLVWKKVFPAPKA